MELKREREEWRIPMIAVMKKANGESICVPISGGEIVVSDNGVSLVGLKTLAKNLLSGSSSLRTLILSEPDYLPKTEAMAKVEIFVKLLYQELGLQ